MARQIRTSFLQRIFAFPFFLLLIGVYPVLFLLSENLGQISPSASIRSVAIAVSISLTLSGLCLLIIRHRPRALMTAGLINVAFFSYGHLFNLVDGRSINGFMFGRHSLFFPMFVIIFLGLLFWILKQSSRRESPTAVLNFLLAVLCTFLVVRIAYYELSSTADQQPQPQVAAKQVSAPNADAPDIYYIILDGLAREDVLRNEYGYTSYTLPEELKKRGFAIPDCAFSNYGTTSLSLASSLNFDYLSTLGVVDEQVNTQKDDPHELNNLLHQNRIVSYLKHRDYAFVSFRGFFPLNDFKEADYYFNIYENEQGQDELAERSFYEMFLRTTLLRLPSEYLTGSPTIAETLPKFLVEWIAPEAGVFSSRSYQWYQQHLYTFEKLETVPALPGKKFVYAHFYSTHQPYVFRPDGSLRWPINENNDGYVAAVEYTSKRILQAIDQILENSATPPVIIVQADHGVGTGMTKHKILNAYYLPNGGESALYPTITPVNTFRVVLNRYAEGNFELLPDNIMMSVEQGKPFVPTKPGCE